MKRILTISIIIMNLLNLFGCKAQNENDPYWEFNKTEHFRPELNKGEFFKLNGFDFGWFVLEPISKFIKDKEHEIERGKSLSYGQKALYYWWYLDAQVTNGGFVQFYYNGYGPYIPTIIKGLEHIGDTEMATLVKKADKIYQKNKKLMDKAQESDLFGSNLYDRLDEMSLLDDKYYEMNEKTMSLIESYIRKNPSEICLDEDGKEFDLTFTGLCKTFYSDKIVKEEFHLEQGVINGEFKSFYENGKLKEQIDYKKGAQTGEREEFFDNGTLKYKVVKDKPNEVLIHKWFYENGVQKKLETKKADSNKNFGESKEWYDNGQLKEQSNFIDNTTRTGKWLKFWKDGSKKLEADFKEGQVYFENYWNEKGEQTLINGTGLYTNEWNSFNGTTIYETKYKNYLRDGKSKTIRKGLVSLEQEFKEGKEHGITRSYYDNGNIEQETIYENGKAISTKKFTKFKNPKVKTNVISKICDGCYKDYEDYVLPDNQPTPINDQIIAEKFKTEKSIFDGYGDDHTLSYGYYLFVNEKGSVEDIKFAVASNMWLDEQVKSSMSKLKFGLALKGGKPIKSIHYVRYELKLTE
jgi:antitoxin component YwqK of YwqJK toxin-antitoxin module